VKLIRVGSRACFALILCVVVGACGKRQTHDNQEPAPTVAAKPKPVAQSVSPPAPSPKTPTCKFEWVNEKQSPELRASVAAAFQPQLHPGDPDAGVSRIALMARCGDAVVVAIERSSGKRDEAWNRWVELYNYNLATRKSSSIEAEWQLWLWKFRGLARFEDGPAPEITFETASCTECEPQFILSALRYDAESETWVLRLWPEAKEGVAVADSAVGVDGSVEEYRTLYGIGDFETVGRDEVAVWTHYRDVDEKDPKKKLPAVTSLTVYRFQNGTPLTTEIKDAAEIKRIEVLLRQMNAKQKRDN